VSILQTLLTCSAGTLEVELTRERKKKHVLGCATTTPGALELEVIVYQTELESGLDALALVPNAAGTAQVDTLSEAVGRRVGSDIVGHKLDIADSFAIPVVDGGEGQMSDFPTRIRQGNVDALEDARRVVKGLGLCPRNKRQCASSDETGEEAQNGKHFVFFFYRSVCLGVQKLDHKIFPDDKPRSTITSSLIWETGGPARV